VELALKLKIETVASNESKNFLWEYFISFYSLFVFNVTTLL
jgi:hypothetical protein